MDSSLVASRFLNSLLFKASMNQLLALTIEMLIRASMDYKWGSKTGFKGNFQNGPKIKSLVRFMLFSLFLSSHSFAELRYSELKIQ